MTTLMRVIAALGLVFGAWLLGGSKSRDEVVRAPIVRLAVKHPWVTVAAMAAVAMMIAAVMVISGVVPIRASSGHWAVTAAFLDFAKTRSVATHSWGLDAPSLDDEALVLRGASHYESACAVCHGAPGRGLPPVMAAMTPPPPVLTERLARWTPEELFSIVKYGIKFTGMPAWPVQERDDEIWAMTAFLRRMPKIDAAGYDALVYGHSGSRTAPAMPSDAGRATPAIVRDLCSRCHGVDGTGRGAGAFPSVAGQRATYVYEALRAFRDRRRLSAIMGEVASRLDDESMRDVALYFEGLPPPAPAIAKDHASVTRGRTIATQGIPARDVPACAECHGPTDLPKNPAYPTLTGQHLPYLTSQLVLLQERRRGGTLNINLMHVFVNRLGRDEIDDVAAYYSTLPAGTGRTAALSR